MASRLRNDLYAMLSLKETPLYTAGNTLADYTLLWRLMDAWPTRTLRVEGRRFCGGRWDTGAELLAIDTSVGFGGMLYPRQAAWLDSYFWGGAAYAVTGASDPFLHTSKKSAPTQQAPDFFAMLMWYDGAAKYFEFCGLQIDRYTIQIPEDGTAPVTFEADTLGSGLRLEHTTGVTVAACQEELCYRASDVTLTLSDFGGSALSGIDVVSATLTHLNGLDPNPRRRSGLYVAAPRECGSENPAVEIELLTLGEPSDDLDDRLLTSGQEYMLTVAFANPTTNRVMTRYYPDLVLTDLAPAFATFNDKHAWRARFRGVLDPTSSLTKANTPGYTTVQTPDATYRAA